MKLNETQGDTIYAILEAIKAAAQPDVQAFEQIDRLVHAAQSVMTDLPVTDEKKKPQRRTPKVPAVVPCMDEFCDGDCDDPNCFGAD